MLLSSEGGKKERDWAEVSPGFVLKIEEMSSSLVLLNRSTEILIPHLGFFSELPRYHQLPQEEPVIGLGNETSQLGPEQSMTRHQIEEVNKAMSFINQNKGLCSPRCIRVLL